MGSENTIAPGIDWKMFPTYLIKIKGIKDKERVFYLRQRILL